MEFPTLPPVAAEKEFYEDMISILDYLLERNTVSEPEIFNLLRTYLKYVIISALLIALANS